MSDDAKMRRRPQGVVITGLGLVTPLGDVVDDVARALEAGQTAFHTVDDERLAKAGVVSSHAASITAFEPSHYLGDGNVRPLDRPARLAASAATLALAASGWRSGPSPVRGEGEEIGLVLGTMFGSVHTISAFDLRAQTAGPNYAKPLDFANSVINAAAGQTAIWHDLRGVNSTVAGGPTAGVEAIAAAAGLISSGRAEKVLAGGAEELAIEAWIGFARAGLMARQNGHGPSAVPFAADRSGFLLGEGAGMLAVESQAAAHARGARALAAIIGHGTAFDPSQGRDVASQADALARAIRQALSAAGSSGGVVDVVSSSAAGDPDRDLAEAMAIADTVGADVPVMAVKASFGECLGAAGALQVAAAVIAIDRGEIPGIAGLEAPDDSLPLRGLSADSRRPRTSPIRHALVTALGFDGKAEALLLRGDHA